MEQTNRKKLKRIIAILLAIIVVAILTVGVLHFIKSYIKSHATVTSSLLVKEASEAFGDVLPGKEYTSSSPQHGVTLYYAKNVLDFNVEQLSKDAVSYTSKKSAQDTYSTDVKNSIDKAMTYRGMQKSVAPVRNAVDDQYGDSQFSYVTYVGHGFVCQLIMQPDSQKKANINRVYSFACNDEKSFEATAKKINDLSILYHKTNDFEDFRTGRIDTEGTNDSLSFVIITLLGMTKEGITVDKPLLFVAVNTGQNQSLQYAKELAYRPLVNTGASIELNGSEIGTYKRAGVEAGNQPYLEDIYIAYQIALASYVKLGDTANADSLNKKIEALRSLIPTAVTGLGVDDGALPSTGGAVTTSGMYSSAPLIKPSTE